MDVQAYDEPEKFRSAIGDFYLADPVRNTLAVTVINHFLDGTPVQPVMLTVHRDGVLHGVAFRTPPWPLIVSGLPVDAMDTVVEHLLAVDPELPGANGPREPAEVFASAWVARTGAGLREALAGRLYELGDLLTPVAAGRARLAGDEDAELLVDLRKAFFAEALGHERFGGQVAPQVRAALDRGDGLHLWEDEGRVVAAAATGRPSAGMCRIGHVYTLPEYRGRGYGSAVTAATARWALDAGAEHVLLFTDLANPTSNSIYQKIGFRPVSDTAEIEFTAAS